VKILLFRIRNESVALEFFRQIFLLILPGRWDKKRFLSEFRQIHHRRITRSAQYFFAFVECNLELVGRHEIVKRNVANLLLFLACLDFAADKDHGAVKWLQIFTKLAFEYAALRFWP
jgi:hypothetical protein